MPRSLRAALKSRLPDYMIPSAFVILPELPRLANGKLDRSRLPSPEADASTLDRLAPRSPIESTLLDIWSAVLGKSGFGMRANFFDLGGHSLLATQIVSRIRSTAGVELPLRQIFDHPTIEETGPGRGHRWPRPGGRRRGAAGADRAGLARPGRCRCRSRSGACGCSTSMDPARRRLQHARHASPARAADQARALRRALDRLVARHEAFRTTFELGTPNRWPPSARCSRRT